MKLDKCPSCGSTLGDRWCVGHKLQQYCLDSLDNDCTWKAQPRIPERKRITNVIDLRVDGFYGWAYHTYDEYGHLSCSSKTFGNKEAAMKDLGQHLSLSPTDTGVLFFTPASVKIKGEMFKVKNGGVTPKKI